MVKLLKYDFQYLIRTHKFIIFPVVAILFAVLSPLTALYINELLTMLMTEGGPQITLPDPTVIDSYSQYLSNLYEIFLIVVIFVAISVFIREKTKGYYPLILSKPINRVKYLFSKYTALNLLIFATLLVSGLVFGYYTLILFEEVSFVIVLSITLLFMLYTMFILSVCLLFSQLFNSYAAASILSFITYIFLNILGGFEKGILNYLPGRLMYRMTEIVLGVESTSEVWITVGVTALITASLLLASILRFRSYDIK